MAISHQLSAIRSMIKRALIFVHRWLGIVLCLVFLLWFPSGIGMMYWDYPSVGADDRLERAGALEPSTITLSAAEAAEKIGQPDRAAQVRLNTFDNRPVYRFRSGRDGEAIVYADTGEEQLEVSTDLRNRIACAWTGQPLDAARVEPVSEVDQWTLQTRFRDVEPLWKYSWPDGQQVYVSEATGEVVQYTTRASRFGAWVGAIPHWLYFTPLRKHGREWSQIVIWSSAIGTFAATAGIVIGVWMYSPSKRYRYAGVPTSIPYRGQKRLHTIFGLVFGVAAATWAFSGMLSMDPFPQPTGGPAGGRRGSGAEGIPQALRGPAASLDAFDAKHPRAALADLGGLRVKELELATFAGEPFYLATLAGGETRVVPLHGSPSAEVDRQRLIDVVTTAAGSGGVEIAVLDQYDRYYLDRRRQRPLPVILARLNDSNATRYYINPKTARIVGAYNAGNWMNRWLYHGLHSLDFPWLYNYRPLWDIVVMTFMLGGTALAFTSLILAWRVLGRKLTSMTGSVVQTADDLAIE